MSLIGYMYFYIHAFVEKTPQRRDAYAWAGVFPAIFLVMHGLAAYFVYSWVSEKPMLPSDELKLIAVFALIALIAAGFIHFVVQKHGERIVKEFARRNTLGHPAMIGGILFVETITSPLWVVGCRMILS